MCNKRFFQTARHLDHLQKGKSVHIKTFRQPQANIQLYIKESVTYTLKPGPQIKQNKF